MDVVSRNTVQGRRGDKTPETARTETAGYELCRCPRSAGKLPGSRQPWQRHVRAAAALTSPWGVVPHARGVHTTSWRRRGSSSVIQMPPSTSERLPTTLFLNGTGGRVHLGEVGGKPSRSWGYDLGRAPRREDGDGQQVGGIRLPLTWRTSRTEAAVQVSTSDAGQGAPCGVKLFPAAGGPPPPGPEPACSPRPGRLCAHQAARSASLAAGRTQEDRLCPRGRRQPGSSPTPLLPSNSEGSGRPPPRDSRARGSGLTRFHPHTEKQPFQGPGTRGLGDEL